MKMFLFTSLAMLLSPTVSASHLDSLPQIGSTRAYHVTWTSADLSTEIFPGSIDATAWFVITGSDGSVDSTLPQRILGGTSPSVTVRATVSALQPRTTYRYRVVAENVRGRREGTVRYFVTAPPAAQTRGAEQITMTSARLYGRCSPNGMQVEVCFTIGVDSTYAVVTTRWQSIPPADTVCVVERDVVGLTPHTRYYCRLLARLVDYPDVSTEGSAIGFTTLSDTAASGTVTLIRITTRTGLSVLLAFGVHTSATSCLDRALGEYELPPFPPGVEHLSARFIGKCLGLGSELDLRPFFTPAQVDTYTVAIRSTSEEYPLVVSWDSTSLPYDGDVTLRAGNIVKGMARASALAVQDVDIDHLMIITRNPHPIRHLPNIVPLCPSLNRIQSIALRGLVYPNGAETVSWFEWGSSDQYGASSPGAQLGDSVAAVRIEVRPEGLATSVLYHYRIVAQNKAGISYAPDGTFSLPSITTVEERATGSSSMTVGQNYPNPGNPMTTIRYELAELSDVVLTVYDILGRQILTLTEGRQEPGPHVVPLDVSKLRSGVYFYQLSNGREVERKRMVVLR
jgi:hypothetical protein